MAVEREAAARAAAKVVAERETEVQAAERAGEAGQEACLTWQEACLIWQEACLIWQEACLAEAKATEPMAVAAGSTEVAMALVTWGQVMAAKMEA
jgi:hypothetical protein